MVLLAVTPIANGVRYLPFVSGSHFPTGAFAVLVILTLINAGLRKLRVVWVLSPAQLVAIWAIIAVSSGIAHNGLMTELVPQLPAYQYYSSAENQWDELFGHNIPSELLIHNADATRTFYEGLKPGQPIPWGVWLTPMAVWGLYAVGMYMMMIGVSVILRRQWVDHERLVFPVVQLPMEIVKAPEGGGALNSLLRNRICWLGVLITFVFHGWIFLARVYPALPALNHMKEVVIDDRPWSALGLNTGPILHVYFCFIGLGYLVSSEASFSMWFFFLFFDAQAVILSMINLPEGGLFTGWTRGGWAQMQQAGGTVALVASFVWLGRRHFAQVFRQAFSAAREVDDSTEPLDYRAAVWVFLLGCAVMVGWLVHYGGSLPLAMFNVALGVGVFATFTWMVCQAGLVYISPNFSSTTILANMTGSRVWGAWPVFVNLWNEQVFRLMMLREFFMPSLMTAYKLSDEVNLDRRSLLKGCIVALAIGLLVAAASKIGTTYAMGGVLSFTVDTHTWKNSPIAPFSIMSSLVGTPVARSPWLISNFLGGFLFVGALIWMRTHLNWLGLHPIGYIIARNNASAYVWLSYFIAWLIKTSVTRWGGYKVYARLRPFFLGLIAGDTLAAGGAIVFGYLTRKAYSPTPW